jgi:PAS domain S-box-containing protein
MTKLQFQLRGVDDPRLAIHATSAQPVWLWSIDGARVLWCNPVGAALFGAANSATLAATPFGPADPHRRQVAQLGRLLPRNETVRLERLRGFGARLGALATCGCARLEFPDGVPGILIVAAQATARPLPLAERLRALVEGIDMPIAAFARDGLFIGANDAARALLGFRNLTEAGLEAARDNALKSGRAETPIGIGHVVLQRVGSGADVGLVALLLPGPVDHEPRPPVELPKPQATLPAQPAAPPEADPPEPQQPVEAVTSPTLDDETAATTGEAPAEYALIDELAAPPTEPTDAPAIESIAAEPDAPADVPATVSESEAPAVETAAVEVPDAETTNTEAEPSPLIAAVADEPAVAPADDHHVVETPIVILAVEPAEDATALAPLVQPSPRRNPLRFVWQMDAEARFSIGSDEFNRLIGPRTAAGFGRRWSEIADAFALDPDGKVARAVAGRTTWSGITLQWPLDDPGERLAVELSGLPVQDREGNFVGYRGFGVCRDLERLTQLASLRQDECTEKTSALRPLSADIAAQEPAVADETAHTDAIASSDQPTSDIADPIVVETSPQEKTETPVETPRNVLPFRPASDPKSPALTPVENSAFNELARQLSARLESEAGVAAAELAAQSTESTPAGAPPAQDAPDWLVPLATPARGASARDRQLLDLVPVGILIYRLDRLLYANRAFLDRMGYASLTALEEDGGLDALFVEAGVTGSSSTSDTGTPITIAAAQTTDDQQPQHAPAAGRLFTITWDGESALALIFDTPPPITVAPAIAATEPSAVGHANAEELGAILDTAAEGIVMFDHSGRINSCNRSAEALFGYDGDELVQRNLAELFAPESQRVVLDYLDSIKGEGAASLDHGREALGRVREGGLFPLSMTIGRTRPDGPNFFAVFRDLSQVRKTESDLASARRQAERAASAKADVLARISHEVRTPLNAIIGFADVMIDGRFGALGSERYGEYMKDIRASGERVIAIINDLLDLSRIETGKIELDFASQDLNELVEHCVAVMQPQANRERIIIRSSLAHLLPAVVADAQALRQITLNLIGTSIHLANAGGQVIVSTALNDFGEVVLRVRDTGHRLNDDELAAAMQPFRTPAPSDRLSEASGVSLSLTKALVEANRARFNIKSAPTSGTLIEVVFSHATVTA